MKVIDGKSIEGGPFDVSGPGWSSLRLLTRADEMGFSLNNTIISAGSEMTLQYKNHLEACYCISGSGSLTDHATQTTYDIRPGVIYALDQNDLHTLRADEGEDMRLVSVFNPALVGTEVHGPDGSYATPEDA